MWAGRAPDVDVGDRLRRLSLNPIVRAQLDRRLDATQRARRYGSLLTHYRITARDDAEVAVLPRSVEQTGRTELQEFVSAAERRGLRTVMFGSYDLEPVMASASIILLHPGPTLGAQPRADVLPLPYFFTDRANGIEPRAVTERPSVAFCGQGASRPAALAAGALGRLALQVRNSARPRLVPPPLRGHVGLRALALARLHEHPGVDGRFVIRDRYRAGASTNDERARTQAEFDDNLRSSTYALCVRGTGNFSARFYEALSFGRVPLFVDTHCVLPFEDQIDWRSRTVWVDADDVGSIGDRLVTAHRTVLADPARSAGALRALWQDRLTQDGYFRHLVPVLRSLL